MRLFYGLPTQATCPYCERPGLHAFRLPKEKVDACGPRLQSALAQVRELLSAQATEEALALQGTRVTESKGRRA